MRSRWSKLDSLLENDSFGLLPTLSDKVELLSQLVNCHFDMLVIFLKFVKCYHRLLLVHVEEFLNVLLRLVKPCEHIPIERAG